MCAVRMVELAADKTRDRFRAGAKGHLPAGVTSGGLFAREYQ